MNEEEFIEERLAMCKTDSERIVYCKEQIDNLIGVAKFWIFMLFVVIFLAVLGTVLWRVVMLIPSETIWKLSHAWTIFAYLGILFFPNAIADCNRDIKYWREKIDTIKRNI